MTEQATLSYMLTIPLIGGGSIGISMPKRVSPENFEYILTILKTMRPALVEVDGRVNNGKEK